MALPFSAGSQNARTGCLSYHQLARQTPLHPWLARCPIRPRDIGAAL